ncbi:MAG: hypothetical protein ACK5HR_04495 [Mycoplasmatales bacterium]
MKVITFKNFKSFIHKMNQKDFDLLVEYGYYDFYFIEGYGPIEDGYGYTMKQKQRDLINTIDVGLFPEEDPSLRWQSIDFIRYLNYINEEFPKKF